MIDAVHNLADAGASIATLIGFSLANKKSDAEHPFGHARIEYMTGVVVSAIITGIGIMMARASFDKIIDPTPLTEDTASLILLIIMVLATLWFYLFNMKLSKLIGSASLKATGIESRNDAIATVAVLCAILFHQFANINIDGFIGMGVAGFIIYSGITMAKETVSPLFGQSPSPETVREIADLVQGHEGVLGIHDLIVHDYGPQHVFASVHIEVDSREDIFKSHALVDDIEKRAQDELQVMLVGHMDPLDTQNPQISGLRETLAKGLSGITGMKGIHDLRIVVGPEATNIIFDVVATHDEPENTFNEVEAAAQKILSGIDPHYVAVVNRDLDYCTNEEDQDREGTAI
jgi:cation diffusion facilitator family transporter